MELAELDEAGVSTAIGGSECWCGRGMGRVGVKQFDDKGDKECRSA